MNRADQVGIQYITDEYGRDWTWVEFFDAKYGMPGDKNRKAIISLGFRFSLGVSAYYSVGKINLLAIVSILDLC